MYLKLKHLYVWALGFRMRRPIKEWSPHPDHHGECLGFRAVVGRGSAGGGVGEGDTCSNFSEHTLLI